MTNRDFRVGVFFVVAAFEFCGAHATGTIAAPNRLTERIDARWGEVQNLMQTDPNKAKQMLLDLCRTDVFMENKLTQDWWETWSTLADAEEWANNADQRLKDEEKLADKLNAVLERTSERLKAQGEPKATNQMVTMLWFASKIFSSYNFEAVLLCMEKLKLLANSSLKIAKSLLSAQSLSQSTIEFDLELTNSAVVGEAVRMLLAEKNGEKRGADQLLESCKSEVEKIGLGYLYAEK